LVGVGPLDLEAIMRPIDRLAVRTALGAGVVDEPDVVAADRRVEAYPVGRRRAADEHELILTLPEKDHVADHVPGRRDRHEMLRTVQIEVREVVDADVGQQLLGVGTLYGQLGHVMRLIEEDRGFAPGALLVAPVREFRGDDRIHVNAGLRVAQQLDGAAVCLDERGQVVSAHSSAPVEIGAEPPNTGPKPHQSSPGPARIAAAPSRADVKWPNAYPGPRIRRSDFKSLPAPGRPGVVPGLLAADPRVDRVAGAPRDDAVPDACAHRRARGTVSGQGWPRPSGRMFFPRVPRARL